MQLEAADFLWGNTVDEEAMMGQQAPPMFPSTDPMSVAGPVQQILALIQGQQAQDQAQLGMMQQQAAEPALAMLMQALGASQGDPDAAFAEGAGEPSAAY
jgi:hypothetical protein